MASAACQLALVHETYQYSNTLIITQVLLVCVELQEKKQTWLENVTSILIHCIWVISSQWVHFNYVFHICLQLKIQTWARRLYAIEILLMHQMALKYQIANSGDCT